MTLVITGLVTARGGSKGIPGKNLKPLAGKPLISWTIEAALHSGRLNQVLISTDDDAIARVAATAGARVPFIRPAELAQDGTPHIDVVLHALRWLDKHGENCDYVMLLQPTAPLRTAEDIVAAIELAEARQAQAVVSVCAAAHHPLLCWRLREDGTLTNYAPSDLTYLRRQDLPPAYALNGAIYLNRRDSLLHDRTFEPPGTLPYIMPEERSLDIDTPWNFHLAELILGAQHESHTS